MTEENKYYICWMFNDVEQKANTPVPLDEARRIIKENISNDPDGEWGLDWIENESGERVTE